MASLAPAATMPVKERRKGARHDNRLHPHEPEPPRGDARDGCDATLVDATRLLHEYGESHLIVLGRVSGRPVGVLSTLDVIDALAELEKGGPHAPALV
jgi:hypothetical protein